MGIEVGGTEIETDDHGYLVNVEDWNEDVAAVLAKGEDIELTQEHWDVIKYLRDEYINNAGHQPNMRALLKGMGEVWGRSVDSKSLYDLFPMGPAKQACKLAGLPETKTKGGY